MSFAVCFLIIIIILQNEGKNKKKFQKKRKKVSKDFGGKTGNIVAFIQKTFLLEKQVFAK